jgi:hypothetical protein
MVGFRMGALPGRKRMPQRQMRTYNVNHYDHVNDNYDVASD